MSRIPVYAPCVGTEEIEAALRCRDRRRSGLSARRADAKRDRSSRRSGSGTHRLAKRARTILAAGWLLAGCGEDTALPSGAGINILLISIDTLRADYLGCYGQAQPTSPHLDALAADGVRFARAISQAPWTTPSHMSLLTSLYPSSHQLNQSYQDFEKTARKLPASALTLAEVLRDNGYRTLALTGGATVAGEIGFHQGFDEYLQNYYKLDERVWDRLVDWLDEPRERPFFIFQHTFHVHAPYQDAELAGDQIDAETHAAMLRAIAAARGEDQAGQRGFLAARGLLTPRVTRALYASGIRVADAFYGRLFDELRRRGLWEKTLIVLTSDHGEEFADHASSKFFDAHGHSQHEELVHVPLLVRFPPFRAAGRVIASPVGLIDVAPTILDLVGIAVPPVMQGRSLKPLWISEAPRSTAVGSEATTGYRDEVKALRTARYGLIATYRTGAGGDHTAIPGPFLRSELFDLRTDPRERRNLAAERPRLAARMRRALEEHFRSLAPGETPEVVPIDEELERALRGLGYLQ